MIKHKKIIRIKNPGKFADSNFTKGFKLNIEMTLETGRIDDLVNTIIYYRQGRQCEDCDKYYTLCKCDRCNDCKQNRCICRFLGDDSKPKDRIRIRKIVWEFVRYINSIHPDFGYKNLVPDPYILNDITKSEADFLKSLTPSSKFPKYTSLMKRLFEID